jgi:hypothetical protein
MPRSRPRHDHDAGGPAELLAAKAELRQEVWAALRAARATRFPGPEGRIPNFVGAVAAGLDGARLGKGGGFSDLEFAVASEAGLIGPDTVVVTTVHEVQVLPAGEIPTAGHDVGLDLIVTPERVIEVPRRKRRSAAGIRWEELTEEKIAAIPLLGRLRAGRS